MGDALSGLGSGYVVALAAVVIAGIAIVVGVQRRGYQAETMADLKHDLAELRLQRCRDSESDSQN